MAGYGTAAVNAGAFWGTPSGTGFWNPFAGSAYKAPEPIQSAATDYKSQGDNSSPIGRVIPTGLGFVVSPGEPVVDPKHLGGIRQVGDKVLVNLVFCLLDTQLGGTFSLVWARANKQFIIRNQSPIRTIKSPFRFYGGNQTAVDPIFTRYLAAQYRTAWPGFVYIVFENFDIAPYDNKVPIFDFQINSDVTIAPSDEVESTLTFGSVGSGFFNFPQAVDFTRGHYYQIFQDAGSDAVISKVQIGSLPVPVEIARVAVSDGSSPMDFGYLNDAVSLQGSDYIVCTSDEPGTGFFQLTLINVTTGVIVDTLAPLLSGPDPFEPIPKSAALLSSGNYHVFCGIWAAGSTAQSGLAVAVADTVNETLAWIIHPYTDPAPGVADTDIYSIAVGSLNSAATQRTIFWTDGGVSDVVYQAKLTTSSFTSSVIYTESNPALAVSFFSVAYDQTDNGLCIYRDDGSIKKIAPGGGTIYETGAQSPDDLVLNVGNYTSSTGFQFRPRPGYAYAIGGGDAGGNDIHEIDLSNGSTTQIIDFFALSLLYGPYQFWDQYTGTMTGPSAFSGGIINRVTLGDAAPNAVDLADIMLALATFDGRHVSGDTAFTNFAGNECYGVKYETDTSIQDALRALREPYDVSIVESDAKLKFRAPRRDGSYAPDATLTAPDFVDKGPYTIEKIAASEEEALYSCEISFFDKDNYGARNEAQFARPIGVYDITKSINRRTINLPLYMTASKALQQAALVVYRSVYALEQYQFSLAPGKAFLEPGDIVSFPFASDAVSFTVVAQVKDAQLNANYTQDVTANQYLQAHDATYTGAQITVPPLAVETLTISGTPVTTAVEDLPYTGFTATGSGGILPYTYSLQGSWPTGISINAGTGAVSGTPPTAGSFPSLSVRVTDALGSTADLPTFTLTVSGVGTAGEPIGLLLSLTRA